MIMLDEDLHMAPRAVDTFWFGSNLEKCGRVGEIPHGRTTRLGSLELKISIFLS